MAARRRAALRAPGAALDDRGRRDGRSQGAAGAVPCGHAGRAALDPRRAARAPRRALPRASGAMTAPVAGPDPAAMAQLLAGYCLDVRPGQHVLVRSTSLAAPLLLALEAAILDRDAWPLLRVELPGQTRVFYEHAQDRHLDLVDDLALPEAKKADALLGIQAPGDPLELAGIDPERITRVARARRDIREQTMKRRWCSTLWPTPSLAAKAGMDDDAFGAFVTSALFLDRPDPVLAWRQLGAFQDQLIMRLQRAREIRIEAAGTDLRLNVAGRTWVN